MVRPEKIEMTIAVSAAPLSGTVTRATKLGSTDRIRGHHCLGETFVIHQQDRTGVAPRALGDVVELTWRPEDSRLLPV